MKLQKTTNIFVSFFSQPRNYAVTAGIILFAIGIVGFAFRSDSSLPDLYLSGAILLGFWGIVSGVWDGGGRYAARRATDKEINQKSL